VHIPSLIIFLLQREVSRESIDDFVSPCKKERRKPINKITLKGGFTEEGEEHIGNPNLT
jgi:hypothetical protein